LAKATDPFERAVLDGR
jgi:DNA polymerase delta subunit 1